MTDAPMSPEERARHIETCADDPGACKGFSSFGAYVEWSIRQAEAAAREPHQQRWQRLVNTVASAWNNGTVPGNDEEAVEWAIQMIADRGHD